MADPISLAASLLALATFGAKASVALYQTISSLNSHKRSIRQLKEELEALTQALESLKEQAKSSSGTLDVLKLPLLRCGQACEEFKDLIWKHLKGSDARISEFKDWAKLQYLGNDISQFRDLIAGYKSTINIALADVNLRTSVITMKLLGEYKEVIINTASDLEDQVEQMSGKLEILQAQRSQISSIDEHVRQQIEEERDSVQQCLRICESVSAHIDELKPSLRRGVGRDMLHAQGSELVEVQGDPARVLTAGTLEICMRNLRTTYQQLHNLQKMRTQKGTEISLDAIANEEEEIRKALDGTEECLKIVSQASEAAQTERVNLYEDVAVAEDGQQIIVSTIGDLIAAKRVTMGPRTVNWMGQMSDESLQAISRDFSSLAIVNQPQRDTSRSFSSRYGSGQSLDK